MIKEKVKVLAVDIGTGTQDVLLFDSRLDVENSFKMVLPSPTMMVFRRLEAIAQNGKSAALHGFLMGGGPSSWGTERVLKAGGKVYATPQAALSFNDDLEAVQNSGITLISEDEIAALPDDIERIELRDFDFLALRQTFSRFGISLDDLDAVAAAVFDHGNAPIDISDRQFRFDYLEDRIRSQNRLSAFAYPAEDIPASMTRLQAVANSARGFDCPLVVMDTAPAAVLGATFDPIVGANPEKIIVNIGNFHTLAFRLSAAGIEGVFEHHTGLLKRPDLEMLLEKLAQGTLTHAEVFNGHGHGAFMVNKSPMQEFGSKNRVVVTGPRRSMLANSYLKPYNAVPFGDMMIAGCFGLVEAVASVRPELADPIRSAMDLSQKMHNAPWDVQD
ncbi:MAG TPA: DUF1786 domain-containing protein [Longilinea sp.]|nr:DUF1786 domain-containing protein [Longilinea sp.]